MNDYNPKDHLITVQTKQGPKPYLPAAWRLYELTLKYENANFASEIVHMDPENNFVIVRARLYLGASYEASDKKSEAHKQGPLSQLDIVETKAMARAARNFGVGTEYALDFDEVDEQKGGVSTGK